MARRSYHYSRPHRPSGEVLSEAETTYVEGVLLAAYKDWGESFSTLGFLWRLGPDWVQRCPDVCDHLNSSRRGVQERVSEALRRPIRIVAYRTTVIHVVLQLPS